MTEYQQIRTTAISFWMGLGFGYFREDVEYDDMQVEYWRHIFVFPFFILKVCYFTFPKKLPE